ncbi:DNA repair family [Fusarium phyllophilum]|uniref:DNA repair family n=1 Tax=Fusarium phyllophilum TaxID=47803 RepID=A0A8H5IS53_9HYPO|nr:DNA repair family [Fusarium phyllophilum]
MSRKRTLDAFFSPTIKKPKTETGAIISGEVISEEITYSEHPFYPHPIKNLPASLSKELSTLPDQLGREINDQPDLDLLYFEPFISGFVSRRLFEFLRSELPFYRVEYKIKRGGIETQIRTPRWTTVFGLDETSKFDDKGLPVDANTGLRALDKQYARYPPRPIPKCLDELRHRTELATGCKYNFCLVNYYASGSDSISFHSDDEQFLGCEPAIASFSLGARRDFLMKHKRPPPNAPSPPSVNAKPLKLPLGSGDMVLMRGRTQSNWLHSIPKRTGKNQDDGGRINITFRRAMVKGGTDNYYNYNVGAGPVYRWNREAREMLLWKP